MNKITHKKKHSVNCSLHRGKVNCPAECSDNGPHFRNFTELEKNTSGGPALNTGPVHVLLGQSCSRLRALMRVASSRPRGWVTLAIAFHGPQEARWKTRNVTQARARTG